MPDTPAMPGFNFSGRASFRLRNIASLLNTWTVVTLQRWRQGPLLPGWSWTVETANYFLRAQGSHAFELPEAPARREYIDAMRFASPVAAQVRTERASAPVGGEWHHPQNESSGAIVLYLHGGGYEYYARAHRGLIALLALATRAPIFALDYRLTPEHPYPAQLEDALAAYRWLLDGGAPPEQVVVMGDSAGGNLALALLQALRSKDIPQPALAVCLCPWTDMDSAYPSLAANEGYDWIEKRMIERWATWYCNGNNREDPLISPVHADLRGLAPIYVQAGANECLIDMIRGFYENAERQNAAVTLDVWPNMMHDFQVYGDYLPESREALQRIGEKVREATG